MEKKTFSKEVKNVRKKYPNAILITEKVSNGYSYKLISDNGDQRTTIGYGINKLRILQKPYTVKLY